MSNIDNEKKSYASRIIDEILQFSGLNQANFCKEIGVSQSFVFDIKTGKTTRITEKNADKIIDRFPSISKLWLLTGEGSMLKSDNSTQKGNVGDNSGIIVQHGDHSTYNNNPNLEYVVRAQQETINRQQDTISSLTETNRQQSAQIGKLIELLSSK